MLVAAGLAGLTAAVISFTKSEKESVTATDRLIDKQKEFSKTLKENKRERAGMVTAAKEEGAQADFLAERLNTLMGVEKKSAGQKAEIKSIVEQLNGIMPDLNLKYNEEKDALNKSTEAIYANIEAQKSLLIAKAMEEQQADVAEDIAATQIKLKEATDNRTTAQQKYNDAIKKAETLEQKWIDSGRSDGQLLSQWSEVENSLEGLNEEYQKADDLVKTYQGELRNLNTEYDKTSELTAEQYNTARCV